MTFNLLKKYNIGNNSFIQTGRASMFSMGIPYDKAFPIVS